MQISTNNTIQSNVNSLAASPAPKSLSTVSKDSISSTIPPVFEASQSVKPQNRPAPSPTVTVQPKAQSANPQPKNSNIQNRLSEKSTNSEANRAEKISSKNTAEIIQNQSNPPFNEDETSTNKESTADKAIETKAADTQAIDIILEQKAQIETLAIRDREVRSHERTIRSAGGDLTGGSAVSFKEGPNGVKYATNVDIPIDTSSVKGNTEATIKKMRVVQQTALAPAESTSSDRATVTAATRILLQAQNDLVAEKSEARLNEEKQASEKRAELRSKQSAAIQVYTQLNAIGVETENSRDIEKLLPDLNLNVYA
mgnify:CR=1 FL=1